MSFLNIPAAVAAAAAASTIAFSRQYARIIIYFFDVVVLFRCTQEKRESEGVRHTVSRSLTDTAATAAAAPAPGRTGAIQAVALSPNMNITD